MVFSNRCYGQVKPQLACLYLTYVFLKLLFSLLNLQVSEKF